MRWSGEVAVLGAIQAGLLLNVVIVEVVVIAAGIGLFLGHGAWMGLVRRRTKANVARGRVALQAALEGGSDSAAPLRQLTKLPRRLRVAVLVDVAPSLAGAHRERLTALATDLGLLAL
ncbi:MAG TPA: hypothetical protein VF711_01460, partial [Acidimicrobiales bacterium]